MNYVRKKKVLRFLGFKTNTLTFPEEFPFHPYELFHFFKAVFSHNTSG